MIIRAWWVGLFGDAGLVHFFGTTAAHPTATYIGPNNGNWSNTANWDIGVVPINNGGNTYNVIVPANKIINYDLLGAGTISGLNLVESGRINISGGQSLNVSGFALVGGILNVA